MIGHYLLTLTEVQEDRVLLGRMGYFNPDGADGCLLQVATGDHRAGHCGEGRDQTVVGVGFHYDDLLCRFGTPRVNAAIRNRILSNRARRVLGHSLVSAGAP